MPPRDSDWTQDEEVRSQAQGLGSQRLAAICAVALIVMSCTLLQSLNDGARPIQSMGWLFGPAAAADRN